MSDKEIKQLIKDDKLKKAEKQAMYDIEELEMNQNIINARVTFRNSPIHVLEKFTIRDLE